MKRNLVFFKLGTIFLFLCIINLNTISAATIEEILLTPPLDVSYFSGYRVDANIIDINAIDANVRLLVSAINGEGGNCWDYYVDGTCGSEELDFSMDYNSTSGLWRRIIYPDYIYPEIYFADSNTTWNNTPLNINTRRDNYQIFKINNSFEMDSNMSFWIEVNIAPNSTSNSSDLLIYLVGKNENLNYFTSDWTNKTNTQLVSTIPRNALFHHQHTINSSHRLVALSTNSFGNIGDKNINIREEFWIVLYNTSPNTSRGWNLRYQPNSLCTTNNWYTGTRSGGTWNLPTINTSGCPDSHIHIARRENYIDGASFTVKALDSNEILLTEKNKIFTFRELPNLAPNQTSFTYPIVGGTYDGNTANDSNKINISWNPATDPNNDLVTYDINYIDSNLNSYSIITNYSGTDINWDITTVPDGNYNLNGLACDNQDPKLCTSFDLNGTFLIKRSEDIYTISNISIYSNNTDNNSYAKDGNFVYLLFSTTGVLQNLAVNFYSNEENTTNSPTIQNIGNDYNVYYEIDSLDSQGLIGFNISATNLDVDYYDTTDNSFVIYDITPPITTIDGNYPIWTNFNQTITLTCNDTNGTGCALIEYQLNDGGWNTYSSPLTINTDNNHKLEYKSTDNINNTENTKTVYLLIDKTAPTYIGIDNNGVQKTEDFNISIRGVDFNLSGKNTAKYRINNGSWVDFGAEYTTDYNLQITSNGITTIDLNFVDNSTNQLLIFGVTADLNKLGPTTNYFGCGNDWNNTNQTITLECFGNGSDCNSLSYRINDGDWNTLLYTNPIQFTLTAEGVNKIDYNSTAVNGIIEETKTKYCKIDKTPPLTSILGNYINWTNFNQTITLSCTDNNSGCANIEYQIDDNDWNNYSSTFTLSTDGNHKVEYKSTDNANNLESTTTKYILIDKTPPIINVYNSGGNLIINNSEINYYDQNYFVDFNATDNNSGVRKYYLRENVDPFVEITDLNYTLVGTIPSSKKLSILVQDNALNQNVFNLTVNFLDSLIGEKNGVTTQGITDLNVTIDGNTPDQNFSGLREVIFLDGITKLTDFNHNFSLSTLDLNKIKIIKTSLGILVDLNGQLQNDQNKTLYLNNNNFISLCVKNAQITSLSEISSTCNGANEYDFTQCLTNGTYTTAGLNCTLSGGVIKVENLRYSGILGTIAQTSSSGSCNSIWSCTNWSECISGTKTRTCTKTNNCSSNIGKPLETQTCIIEIEENNKEPEINNNNQNNEENKTPISSEEKSTQTNNTDQNNNREEIIQEESKIMFIILVIIILLILGTYFFILGKKQNKTKSKKWAKK
jgi:hypothetical protein